jgi:RNA polymerase sigma factor (sigma-70 family)
MLPLEMLPETREAYERCQRRFPTISLPFDSFCQRMEEILDGYHSEHVAVPAGTMDNRGCSACATIFRQLHHEDLFLVLACSSGDRVAWVCFTEEYFVLLRRLAACACRSLDAGEDLAQELITILLGQGERAEGGDRDAEAENSASERVLGRLSRGKLRTYNGRGSLAGWLRAAVAHAAIDRFRRGRRIVSLDELPDQPSPPTGESSGPAAETEERLDAHWGPVLARVLQEEISRLDDRDRLLLDLYYLQNVPLKSIGRQFGVHEATASRWLDRLRQGLRKRVEQTLRKRHGLRPQDLGSLWHWVGEGGDDGPGIGLRTLLSPVGDPKKMQDGTA